MPERTPGPINSRLFPSNRDIEDYRTDAQTDRDRIWYSYEFRRLGGVTQVIPPQEDDLFHDRLTHSVKVAQVAETIARRLTPDLAKEQWATEHGVTLDEWIDPTYCYVAALAHDIGHPPFGHAGESFLQTYMGGSGNGDVRARSFEGNAQSTRIVSTLSFRKDLSQPGLNPTYRSVAAIAKYPWLRGKHPHSIPKLAKKWSFYPEEAWILAGLIERGFVAVEKTAVLDGDGVARVDRNRNPVERVVAVHRWPEAEIMDWADDISYAVHDLEDFFRVGKIPLHSIGAVFLRAEDDVVWQDVDFSSLTQENSSLTFDRELKAALAFATGRMRKMPTQDGGKHSEEDIGAALSYVAELAKLIPTGPFDGTRASHVSLQGFASSLITDLIAGASLSLIQVGEQKRVQVGIEATMALVAEFFKSLCYFFVIRTSTLSTMQRGQARSLHALVKGLFTAALEWIGDGAGDNTIPARLGEYIRDTLPDNADEDELRAVVLVAVVDFVCSLRDQQANLLTARLTGQQSGGWTARWIDG